MDQSLFDDWLAAMDARLAEVHARYDAWNKELARYQKDLQDSGADLWKAVEAADQRRKEMVQSGECPVDLDKLSEVLDALCGTYLEVDAAQRTAIRGILDDKRTILDYLYGYMGRASRLLGSSKDVRWLRMGLAAASIEDMRVDWRDLLICLGDLYLAAKDAEIRPGRHFREVAELSSTDGRYGQRSTHALLRDFHKSGHLRSITGEGTRR